MRNDVKEEIFLKDFIIDKDSIRTDDSKISKEILENLDKIKVNNLSPDFILELEDIVYGIERFCIDDSDSSTGGSRYIKDTRKALDSIFIDKSRMSMTKNEGTCVHLRNNIMEHLDSHYKKLNQYKKNIKRDNKELKIVFIIDIVHCDEFRTMKGFRRIPIRVELPEYVEIFKKYDALDAIIFKVKNEDIFICDMKYLDNCDSDITEMRFYYASISTTFIPK